MTDVEYLDNGKIAIFNNHKYVRDDKTGYYLCHDAGGTGTRLHRDVWCFYNGDIPKGYSIHHIDHNKSNNEINNLQMLSNSEHIKLHGAELTDEQRKNKIKNLEDRVRPKAIEWHKSEDGRKWHSEMQKKTMSKREPITYTCDNCGHKFQTIRYYGENENKFCSNACKSAYRRKLGVDNEERVCEYCGKTYIVGKYLKRRFCSRECGVLGRKPRERKSAS